jgi:hypothetical protein
LSVGLSIGRGFVPESLPLEPFKGKQVTSRFNLNDFGIPGAVKEVLDEDKIDATVRGTFYVKGRYWTRRLPYAATSTIPLKRDEEPKPAPATGLAPSAPAVAAAPGKAIAPKNMAPKTPAPKKPVPKSTVPLPSLKDPTPTNLK